MILTSFRPSVRRWEATINNFDRMRHEMEHLVDSIAGGTSGHLLGTFPATNITQTPDCFHIRTELPGVKISDLEISTVDRKVAVQGRRDVEPEENGVSYHRRERKPVEFNRNIELPSEFDREKVEASLTNGVLTITLPRVEAAKPRTIQVSN